MSAHDLCRNFLVATRHTARAWGSRTDQGFGVTHTTDRRYWFVQDSGGSTVYEGNACCAWDARSRALLEDPEANGPPAEGPL
jgi:hypothetical protein